MKNEKPSLPIVLPSKGIIRIFLRVFYSLTNFTKASILSLFVLAAILILLTQMEQAFTMLLHMVESERLNLLMCFLMVNLLALGFSHFPIYTYFAGNLNNSRRSITWLRKKPFSVAPFSWITIHIYKTKPFSESRYVADVYANILRQSLGLAIFCVWFHFIFSAYKPNLIYLDWYADIYQTLLYSTLVVPFLAYGLIRRKLSPLKSSVEERKRIYRRIGRGSVVFLSFSVIGVLFLLFYGNLFSPIGLVILLLTTYAMMMYYAFFRLVRPRIRHVVDCLNEKGKHFTSKMVKLITWFPKPTSFLALFIFSFIACFLIIIYFNIAGLNSLLLPNGILIVLVYVYFYFYIIAALGKYYFVQMAIAGEEKKKGNFKYLDNFTFKALTGGLIVFVVAFLLGFFTESNQNELEIRSIPASANPTTLDEFSQQFQKGSDTVFFVASHGGGLKANAWTLHVLNELDHMSKGNFITQTVALSGASGGSLGLALYGNILGEKKGNNRAISKVIGDIEKGNYASADVALLFGFDFLRSLYPLNQWVKTKNRSYMSMLKYQQKIRGEKDPKLDVTNFRSFWSKLNHKKRKLPALIMNTASTSGRRGVFFSLKTPYFDSIFPFSENLADLRNKLNYPASLSFYNAVSTTNRFPIFSPAAKIKGVGHFIDAGAIDNSGLLGCWDLYLHLRGKGLFENKVVVFVEIINGKSNYVEHILENFVQKNPRLPFKLNEKEKSSILANIETGMNLDKIPGYLEGFMKNYSSNRKDLEYSQIFLPHKISIEDIEKVLNAEVLPGIFRERLIAHLNKLNKKILRVTDPSIRIGQQWKFYEPVLSRQLSKSNLNYYRIMKKHPLSGTTQIKRYFQN